MSYAVISVGGKQYLVHEGERLLVDRLPQKEGATFKPQVLLGSADGKGAVSADKVAVSVRVVGHTLGEKIRIGKLKRRTGYRRHTGFRAKLSQIEIESIGAAAQKTPAKADATPKAEAVAAPTRTRTAKSEETAEQPQTAAKAPARKPAARKEADQEQAAAPKPARKPRAKKEE